MSSSLDLESAYAAFEESTDFTVGLEEEFAILDLGSLELAPQFEELRDAGQSDPVLAVPSQAAQELADELVEAGVKIIFNYSDALLQVPPEVTVHTSSPAVDLLYALYFYLT